MKPWFVVFETRQRGSIGEFEHIGMSSPAQTREEAIREVFDALQAKGLETRFPVSVYQYEENEQ